MSPEDSVKIRLRIYVGAGNLQIRRVTLDVAERRLSKDGEPVVLAPKTHEVLVALVRNAGRLLTKREILDIVWPEAFVEEGILAVHVSGLRKALGDAEAGQRYIETVSRAGYRFMATVTPSDRGRPWLWSFGVPSAPPAIQPEVYELIGRGRSHLLKASMFDVPKAVASFRAAIELDPSYAPAHAGLALACCAQAKLRLVHAADSIFLTVVLVNSVGFDQKFQRLIQ